MWYKVATYIALDRVSIIKLVNLKSQHERVRMVEIHCEKLLIAHTAAKASVTIIQIIAQIIAKP